MDGRRHPKRFLRDLPDAGKNLKSFEGLDDDSASDYKFHKDALDTPLSELPKMTLCVCCGNKTVYKGKAGGDVCSKCLNFFSQLSPPPEGITD